MTFSYLDIVEFIFAEMKHVSLFMTSAKVVMDASGLRIEAIRSIAREQGIEIEDEQSRCIDENLLEELANAHVRRLKSYFNNTRRYISEVSGADLKTFVEFCKTFKKHQIDFPSAQTWNDIDTDAIREQFLKKVHSSTPTRTHSIDLFAECDNFKLSKTICKAIIEVERQSSRKNLDDGKIGLGFVDSYNIYSGILSHCLLTNDAEYDDDKTILEDFLHKGDVIHRVTNSFWYQTKSIRDYVFHKDKRVAVKRVTIPARYHIFSKSDDDDFISDSANYNINRVLMNVA